MIVEAGIPIKQIDQDMKTISELMGYKGKPHKLMKHLVEANMIPHVERLLHLGIDVKKIDENRNAEGQDSILFVAYRLKNLEIFEHLFAHSDKDHPIVHQVAKEGNLKALEILLRHHVNVNAVDSNKLTPLYEAARGGHIEVMKTLLEYRADVNGRVGDDEKNFTPLHGAARLGSEQAVRLLVDSKADPNAMNPFERTPLNMAAKIGRVDLIELLWASGARFHNSYMTPLDEALRNGHKKAAQKLRQLGDVERTAKYWK